MKLINSNKGFTLIEVLVAIAILGFSITALFLAQTRAMRLADQATKITQATLLARGKLLDCEEELKKAGFLTDYSSNGDFTDDGFPNYSWECHSYRFIMPAPNSDTIATGLKAAGPNAAASGFGAQASMLSPLFGMISTTLGNSVRELVVIIKWKTSRGEDDVRVTTHLIDRKAMIAFAASLSNTGIPGLGGSQPAATPETKTPETPKTGN